MPITGLHLLAVLKAELPDDEIPPAFLSDFRGLQREYDEQEEEQKSLQAMRIERRSRMRVGKPDPFPGEDLGDD